MDHFALCAEYAMKAADYLKEHQIKADTVTPCPTHPLFARRTFDHELYLQDNPHEMVYCFVTSPNMKVLFERADHQALVSELQKRMNAFDPFNEKN
ncbi:MAG: hypothetical protein IJZ37_06425 [Clostridia bacterium]|nr:hypothetical protein [Clostridia bacterium]MBQ8399887.1 hypothetical protein [Clostridia bacterium]